MCAFLYPQYIRAAQPAYTATMPDDFVVFPDDDSGLRGDPPDYSNLPPRPGSAGSAGPAGPAGPKVQTGFGLDPSPYVAKIEDGKLILYNLQAVLDQQGSGPATPTDDSELQDATAAAQAAETAKAELAKQNTELQGKVVQLEQQVEEHQQIFVQHDADSKQDETKKQMLADETRKRIEAQVRHIQTLTEANTKTELKNAELGDAHAKLAEMLTAAQSELEELRALTMPMEANEAEIAEQKTALGALQARLTEATENLENAHGELETSGATSREQLAKIGALQRDLAAQAGALAGLHSAVDEADTKRRQTEAKLDTTLASLSGAAQALQNSTPAHNLTKTTDVKQLGAAGGGAAGLTVEDINSIMQEAATALDKELRAAADLQEELANQNDNAADASDITAKLDAATESIRGKVEELAAAEAAIQGLEVAQGALTAATETARAEAAAAVNAAASARAEADAAVGAAEQARAEAAALVDAAEQARAEAIKDIQTRHRAELDAAEQARAEAIKDIQAGHRAEMGASERAQAEAIEVIQAQVAAALAERDTALEGVQTKQAEREAAVIARNSANLLAAAANARAEAAEAAADSASDEIKQGKNTLAGAEAEINRVIAGTEVELNSVREAAVAANQGKEVAERELAAASSALAVAQTATEQAATAAALVANEALAQVQARLEAAVAETAAAQQAAETARGDLDIARQAGDDAQAQLEAAVQEAEAQVFEAQAGVRFAEDAAADAIAAAAEAHAAELQIAQAATERATADLTAQEAIIRRVHESVDQVAVALTGYCDRIQAFQVAQQNAQRQQEVTVNQIDLLNCITAILRPDRYTDHANNTAVTQLPNRTQYFQRLLNLLNARPSAAVRPANAAVEAKKNSSGLLDRIKNALPKLTRENGITAAKVATGAALAGGAGLLVQKGYRQYLTRKKSRSTTDASTAGASTTNAFYRYPSKILSFSCHPKITSAMRRAGVPSKLPAVRVGFTQNDFNSLKAPAIGIELDGSLKCTAVWTVGNAKLRQHKLGSPVMFTDGLIAIDPLYVASQLEAATTTAPVDLSADCDSNTALSRSFALAVLLRTFEPVQRPPLTPFAATTFKPAAAPSTAPPPAPVAATTSKPAAAPLTAPPAPTAQTTSSTSSNLITAAKVVGATATLAGAALGAREATRQSGTGGGQRSVDKTATRVGATAGGVALTGMGAAASIAAGNSATATAVAAAAGAALGGAASRFAGTGEGGGRPAESANLGGAASPGLEDSSFRDHASTPPDQPGPRRLNQIGHNVTALGNKVAGLFTNPFKRRRPRAQPQADPPRLPYPDNCRSDIKEAYNHFKTKLEQYYVNLQATGPQLSFWADFARILSSDFKQKQEEAFNSETGPYLKPEYAQELSRYKNIEDASTVGPETLTGIAMNRLLNNYNKNRGQQLKLQIKLDDLGTADSSMLAICAFMTAVLPQASAFADVFAHSPFAHGLYNSALRCAHAVFDVHVSTRRSQTRPGGAATRPGGAATSRTPTIEPPPVAVPQWCKDGQRVIYLGKEGRGGQIATIIAVERQQHPGDSDVFVTIQFEDGETRDTSCKLLRGDFVALTLRTAAAGVLEAINNMCDKAMQTGNATHATPYVHALDAAGDALVKLMDSLDRPNVVVSMPLDYGKVYSDVASWSAALNERNDTFPERIEKLILALGGLPLVKEPTERDNIIDSLRDARRGWDSQLLASPTPEVDTVLRPSSAASEAGTDSTPLIRGFAIGEIMRVIGKVREDAIKIDNTDTAQPPPYLQHLSAAYVMVARLNYNLAAVVEIPDTAGNNFTQESWANELLGPYTDIPQSIDKIVQALSSLNLGNKNRVPSATIVDTLTSAKDTWIERQSKKDADGSGDSSTSASHGAMTMGEAVDGVSRLIAATIERFDNPDSPEPPPHMQHLDDAYKALNSLIFNSAAPAMIRKLSGELYNVDSWNRALSRPYPDFAVGMNTIIAALVYLQEVLEVSTRPIANALASAKSAWTETQSKKDFGGPAVSTYPPLVIPESGPGGGSTSPVTGPNDRLSPEPGVIAFDPTSMAGATPPPAAAATAKP